MIILFASRVFFPVFFLRRVVFFLLAPSVFTFFVIAPRFLFLAPIVFSCFSCVFSVFSPSIFLQALIHVYMYIYTSVAVF